MNVYFSDEQDEPVDHAGLRDLAEMVLVAEGLPPETEMALILVGAEHMAVINDRFMGRAGPTDVLAFPLSDLTPGEPPLRMANDPPVSLGDVFVCPAEVKRHARREGLPFDDWLCLLAVHGILHLLGYHHDDDGAADLMEGRERHLLQQAGRVVS